MIIAVDPGNELSAYVILGEGFGIEAKGKVPNAELLNIIEGSRKGCETLVIERIASYGMPVGKTVFETCEWVGRFAQVADQAGYRVEYIYRQEEKMAICHDARAGDANIRHALIDRFAKHDFRTGKGTKSNPDVFFGFAKDEWAAMAVAVTYIDKEGLNL